LQDVVEEPFTERIAATRMRSSQTGVFMGKVIRVILFVLLLGGPLLHSLPAVNHIRNSYQTSVVPSSKKSEARPVPENQSVSKLVPEPLTQQNKQMIDWGVLLLGGIIALVITTNVHPIKHYEWLFLIVTLAVSYLLGSLAAGVVFQRRAAYLAFQTTEDFDGLFALLQIQSEQLASAILALGAFAVIFLSGIVFGSVKPYE
jgi:hypothetical protein